MQFLQSLASRFELLFLLFIEGHAVFFHEKLGIENFAPRTAVVRGATGA